MNKPATTKKSLEPVIWLKPGILCIFGRSLNASKHKHYALQLIWPNGEAACSSNGKTLRGNVIIGSQVEHDLIMTSGWVILVEPNSVLGEKLSAYLEGQQIRSFDNICSLSPTPLQLEDDLSALLRPLFEAFGHDQDLAKEYEANTVSDGRIGNLVTELDRGLNEGVIDPADWKASLVSSNLGISESRFLHLFSAEMGMAWRPYILWRRIIRAVNSITCGDSATEAAHLAGFSDSAHLSRTFRRTFGMSIREALLLIKSTTKKLN